jgi:hypothetical protein
MYTSSTALSIAAPFTVFTGSALIAAPTIRQNEPAAAVNNRILARGRQLVEFMFECP